jgi:chemotaxis protein CheZ
MTLTATAATNSSNDSPELEALFESIISAQQVNVSQPNSAGVISSNSDEPKEVYSQVGQLTRKLHDTLRELGADQALEKAASAIPDTCERLSYVANLTDQAAHKALAAIEVARPIQDNLERDAATLNSNWDKFFKQELSVEQFKLLVQETRAFLSEVPARARATNEQLHEIMMAQDFQDLTGQVIKRVTSAAQEMQNELLQLLIDTAPKDKRKSAESNGLLNGPVIKADGRSDVVTNQQQVDELLHTLGF